jgi:general secretion pathway protein A
MSTDGTQGLYTAWFGMKAEPFSIAPDPRYLFMSERHREALAHLLYGVSGGGGFVLLTGEIGAGKTTVCRAFLEQIPRRCNVAYIFNPKLSVPELLQAICEEFRIPVPVTADSNKACIDALNQFLLRTHAVGQNNVLIIDEAQNLDPAVLEQLRLLTNLETSERKLLQIMLIGQPELRQILQQPSLEQLAQRVIARYHLDALSPKETAQYIRHRLAVAGLPDSELFEARAAARVHQLTGGVPRRINLLCDRALLGAYALNRRSVSQAMVDKAATEVFDLDRLPGQPPHVEGVSRLPRWAWPVLGAAALAAGGAVLAVQHPQHWPHLWIRPVAAAASAHAPASATAPPTAPAASSRPTGGPVAAAPSLASHATASLLPQRLDLSQAIWRKEDDALQALARRWDRDLPARDTCSQALKQQLPCFSSSAGLALIRQLERPVVLTLLDEEGRTVYGLLTDLTDRSATLVFGEQTQTVSLTALALAWRGQFSTFWLAPEGYRQKLVPGSKGPAVDWLAQRLASVQQTDTPNGAQTLDAVLQSRLTAFQVSQGIKPDGMAGAMTFMQINRLTGVTEPRLQTTGGGRVLHP